MPAYICIYVNDNINIFFILEYTILATMNYPELVLPKTDTVETRAAGINPTSKNNK